MKTEINALKEKTKRKFFSFKEIQEMEGVFKHACPQYPNSRFIIHKFGEFYVNTFEDEILPFINDIWKGQKDLFEFADEEITITFSN